MVDFLTGFSVASYCTEGGSYGNHQSQDGDLSSFVQLRADSSGRGSGSSKGARRQFEGPSERRARLEAEGDGGSYQVIVRAMSICTVLYAQMCVSLLHGVLVKMTNAIGLNIP